MAKVAGIGEWAKELCAALGEDPSMVYSIVIDCTVDQAVTATITRYVDSYSDVLETIKKVAWIKETEKA